MSRFRLILSVFLAGLFSLMTVTASADVMEIITPVPAPKQTVVIPEGYVNCFTVGAGWYKDVWYPEHRVCQYNQATQSTAQGDAYVEDHWACTKFLTSEHLKGQCTNWDWVPGHWVKTLPVY